MLKINTLFLLFSLNISYSQAIYEYFESEFLEDSRELKIQLPRNYNENLDKEYPLIIVLDGDYMFEAVSGSVDYLSYSGNIPESIIVGINQYQTRYDDCLVLDRMGTDSYEPISSSKIFYDFITEELISHFDKNYRTTKFKVAVGHKETANYINYFLSHNKLHISGFIAISPKFSYEMDNYLIDKFKKTKSNIFYYLVSSNAGSKSINKSSEVFFEEKIIPLKNDLVSFKYKQHQNLTTRNLPIHSIPEGLEYIFASYAPINLIEYNSASNKTKRSPVKYLLNKYENINSYYGLNKPILEEDFMFIDERIEESQQFKYYEDLSKLATKNYPKTILGSWYMGLYHEKKGDFKKAIQIYRSSYTLQDVYSITKDELLDRADVLYENLQY